MKKRKNMKKRFNSLREIVQRNFWFLLFVLIAIMIYTFISVNCYKISKENHRNLYQSIATELAKNADGDVTEIADVEIKIVISSVPKFGLFDSLTAELNNGELNFDYTSPFDSMFTPSIVCLFFSLLITIILYFVKRFVFNTFFTNGK